MFHSTHLAVTVSFLAQGPIRSGVVTDQFICSLHAHILRPTQRLGRTQNIGHHRPSEECSGQTGRTPRETLGLADCVLLFPSVASTDEGDGCRDLVIFLQDFAEVEGNGVLD